MSSVSELIRAKARPRQSRHHHHHSTILVLECCVTTVLRYWCSNVVSRRCKSIVMTDHNRHPGFCRAEVAIVVGVFLRVSQEFKSLKSLKSLKMGPNLLLLHSRGLPLNRKKHGCNDILTVDFNNFRTTLLMHDRLWLCAQRVHCYVKQLLHGRADHVHPIILGSGIEC